MFKVIRSHARAEHRSCCLVAFSLSTLQRALLVTNELLRLTSHHNHEQRWRCICLQRYRLRCLLSAMLLRHLAENQRRSPQNSSALALRYFDHRMLFGCHHISHFWLCSNYSYCNVRLVLSCFSFFYHFAYSHAHSFTSFVIALGELPFCLGWIPAVKVWSTSVAPYLEQYWARALVYTGYTLALS